MSNTSRSRIGIAATVLAVLFGGLLMLMGGGHYFAVTELARSEGRPFDFQLVSSITMSGIIATPGILSVVLAPWLWRTRGWAFAMVIAASMGLLAYLLLLFNMDKADPPKVGSELNMAISAVVLYMIAQGGLWIGAAVRSRQR